jgi:hypothetical protein
MAASSTSKKKPIASSNDVGEQILDKLDDLIKAVKDLKTKSGGNTPIHKPVVPDLPTDLASELIGLGLKNLGRFSRAPQEGTDMPGVSQEQINRWEAEAEAEAKAKLKRLRREARRAKRRMTLAMEEMLEDLGEEEFMKLCKKACKKAKITFVNSPAVVMMAILASYVALEEFAERCQNRSEKLQKWLDEQTISPHEQEIIDDRIRRTREWSDTIDKGNQDCERYERMRDSNMA